MTCAACEHCMREPMADHFRNGCFSCEARALASVGAHVDSQAAQAITPQFRQALERMFGERWKDGAVKVKEWAERIDQAAVRRKAKA